MSYNAMIRLEHAADNHCETWEFRGEVDEKTFEKLQRILHPVSEFIPTQPKQAEPSIEYLDLSVRSYNCLMRAGIRTIEQLERFIQEDPVGANGMRGLAGVRNLGRRNVEEIEAHLEGWRAEPSKGGKADETD